MSGQFASRVALVTGAVSGIGRASTQMFAKGALVVVANVASEPVPALRHFTVSSS